MSPLVKKEIRLVLPAAITAMLLAFLSRLRPLDDSLPVCLLFIGMVMMALSSFGRESSLNTFSALLAQPTERTKIWQTKLSVLLAAFFLVSLIWFLGGGSDASAVSYSGVFVAVTTFTGGLWSTLLLRQLAGAFWITLLVPVVLASVTGGFLSYAFTDSDSAIYAGLAVLLLVYSLGGFFFARTLFFHAQDVGWTGGTIDLSFGSGTGATETVRQRRPFRSLLKKEIKLQSASLVCAAILFVFHMGVIIFRHFHHFQPESVGDILTSLVWMAWLVFPLFISCLSMAEERRLGVMESQLCLPVSRRLQFAIKVVFTLLLGVFLGGVLPEILESFGHNIVLGGAHNIPLYMGLICGWLGVAGFFGSSLARHFLQAIGYSIVTLITCSLTLSAFMEGRMFGFDRIPFESLLTVFIAAPVLVGTLLWLSWLNFTNFREGWALWRRNLISFVTAIVFITITTHAIYNRAWEIVLPAESSHGPARLSLTGPRATLLSPWNGLQVRLPDGRVWFARFQNQNALWRKWLNINHSTIVEPHFISGSNWLSVATGYIDTTLSGARVPKDSPLPHILIQGYRDVVGVRSDGSLWVSDPSPDGRWMGDHLHRFGTETDWLQTVNFHEAVLLLKTDGTLWQWGPTYIHWANLPGAWPTLHTSEPIRVGIDSDWAVLHPEMDLARKSDGSVWWFSWSSKEERFTTGRSDVAPDSFHANCVDGQNRTYVDPAGRLWTDLTCQPDWRGTKFTRTGYFQISSATNWIDSVATWQRVCAIDSSGSLRQWTILDKSPEYVHSLPATIPGGLSANSDWIALDRSEENYSDIIALAADGSLWVWPDPNWYYEQTLVRPSGRPRYLGNIFLTGN